MLTSFFGFSKVTNYILLSIFILISYIVGLIGLSNEVFTITNVLDHLFWGGVLVFSMLLLDFIVRKNALTKSTTYGTFIYTVCLAMLPVIFTHSDILIANVFLLLALRRILSLRSDRNSEKKILDASFYIAFAVFFYFWSWLFFILLFIAIIRKPQTQFRYFFIPVIGLITVFVLLTTWFLLTTDSFSWMGQIQMGIDLDFSRYNTTEILIPTTLLLTLALWMGGSRVLKLSTLKRKNKGSAILLLFALLITLIITVASPEKTGAELLFVLAPIAIISANYFEKKDKEKRIPLEFWFKEILLWLLVLLPVILWLL